jgi:cell division protein FtsI/penicillin-binding protein 2
MTLRLRTLCSFLAAISLVAVSFARTPEISSKSAVSSQKKTSRITASRSAKKRAAHLQSTRPVIRTVAAKKRRRPASRYRTSSFAGDITAGDQFSGEDPIVRQAAVDALGNMNGTLVAIDPDSGRILAMVNQKLALSQGAQPCSTIKVAVALAALSEGVIDRETPLPLSRTTQMNLTEALAVSNNAYFEAVGRSLGFGRVSYYARQFGLGELAGFNIEGEHPGLFPSAEPARSRGGVGKMCSYGEGISITPLQLGALVSAIANGGTLYYLQHPTSAEEIVNLQPKVKRRLAITNLIPEISDGMVGAVEYGTARSLRLSFSEEQILGKTGTCSRAGTRFGWFASYANTRFGRVVAVIFLQGGHPTYGPKAAEISGHFYRALYDHNFFSEHAASASSAERSPATVGVPQ